MAKDMRIYDKYLNMEVKQKKKIDFSFKFKSKNQIIGFAVFLIGLILICSGFILMFSKKYIDKAVPNDNIIKNVNIKDFNSISTPDGVVSIDSTRIIYKKDEGLSEINLSITCNSEENELPIKITFDLDGKDIIIADYLVDIHVGEPITLYKQNENDLTVAKDWKVEITTKEDLVANYGFSF